jgi:hypothetical protein
MDREQPFVGDCFIRDDFLVRLGPLMKCKPIETRGFHFGGIRKWRGWVLLSSLGQGRKGRQQSESGQQQSILHVDKDTILAFFSFMR